MNNPYRELSKVNPQREDGHRRINNDIWQALIKADLSGSAFRVCFYIIDRSWGYDLLEVTIGISQFCKATLLSHQGVLNGIKEAEIKHLLVVQHNTPNPKNPNTYLFNKYYDTWLTSTQHFTSTLPCTETSKQPCELTSKAPTPEVSLPIERGEGRGGASPHTENKKRGYTGLNNKENKNTDPDRFFKGKYGHMVNTGNDIEDLISLERAERIRQVEPLK